VAFHRPNKTSTTTSIHMKDTNDPSDAATYNSFISASVDISNAHVSHHGILSYQRSARDIDINLRRKFLHHVVLQPNNGSTNNININDSSSSSSSSIQPILLPPTQLSPTIKARKPSPSGNKIAIFLKSDHEQMIEIWTEGGSKLARKISIPPSLHGDICFDTSWFGSLEWNKEETAIVYSAERKTPGTTSYFDSEKKRRDRAKKGTRMAEEEPSSIDNVGATNTLGYGIGENWGEKYVSTCLLDLYVVHVETGNIGKVENVPGGDGDPTSLSESTLGGFTLGQASFSPDGNYLVYTSWDAGGGGNMPKRLGSIYCYQRHCEIYQSSVKMLMEKLASDEVEREDVNDNVNDDDNVNDNDKEEGFVCLTPNDRLARSPRFLTGGVESKLVWLSNRKGFDTHGGTMGLSSLEWNADNGAVMDSRDDIIEVVELPEDDHFPGLFLNQLPGEPFASQDGRYIFATTQWRSVTKIIRIDIREGKVQPISFNLNGESETFASQALLCMSNKGDAIVAQSEPNSPAVIGYLSAASLSSLDSGSVQERVPSSIIARLGPIAATSTVALHDQTSDNSLSYQVIRVYPPHGEVKAPVEGILLLPPEAKHHPVPLIVVPHGGPHSCTPTSYIPSYAYLSQGKYAILHVNFRGSSGFGQSALESLAGKAGTQDVKDVVYLTEHVLERYNDSIDCARVGVCGGSHGGFLGGHLIGQHPELFKVAAMRNPVTNIATMTTATDIPDWCYVESLGLGSYDWSKFRGPTADDLAIMWAASRECFQLFCARHRFYFNVILSLSYFSLYLVLLPIFLY
jgi:acylaminoacyl-peptidase